MSGEINNGQISDEQEINHDRRRFLCNSVMTVAAAELVMMNGLA